MNTEIWGDPSNVCGLHIEYRPGWSFQMNGHEILAVYTGPNVEKEGTVTIRLPFRGGSDPSLWDRQTIIDVIVTLIGEIESHERLERLRVDGRKAFDLHPDSPNDFTEGRALAAEMKVRLIRKFGMQT